MTMQIQAIKGSKKEKIVQVQIENGTFSDIQICGLKLNIHFPNGQIRFGKVIFYHAIETGLFLWKCYVIRQHLIDEPYYIIESLDIPFIRLSEHRIVEFSSSLENSSLWLTNSNERYETFEEAYEKSIVPTLIKNADRIEKRNYYEEYKRIYLSKHIDDFFYLPMTSHLVAKITEIIRQDRAWKIKITGAPPPQTGANRAWPPRYDPNGSDNRKAIFILSDDYEVLEVKEESTSTQ